MKYRGLYLLLMGLLTLATQADIPTENNIPKKTTPSILSRAWQVDGALLHIPSLMVGICIAETMNNVLGQYSTSFFIVDGKPHYCFQRAKNASPSPEQLTSLLGNALSKTYQTVTHKCAKALKTPIESFKTQCPKGERVVEIVNTISTKWIAFGIKRIPSPGALGYLLYVNGLLPRS